MNRALLARLERAERTAPKTAERPRHQSIAAAWLNLSAGGDGFAHLCCWLDGEELTDLQAALIASTSRGFTDQSRHGDEAWMAALRAACDLALERQNTARNGEKNADH